MGELAQIRPVLTCQSFARADAERNVKGLDGTRRAVIL